MYYNDIPERPINPPEDTRAVVYKCEICGEEILEGDDYYDIPGYGICCEDCIKETKRYSAELEY